MNKALAIFALVLSIAVRAGAATSGPVPQPLPPQLVFLQPLIGDWKCAVTYETVVINGIPVTEAHRALAAYHLAPDVANTWVAGHYVEFQVSLSDGTPVDPQDPLTAPISVLDLLGVNVLSVPVRSFVDSHGGQSQSVLTPSVGTLDAAGSYDLVPLEFAFSEHLQLAADGKSFVAVSQINGITFNTQHCTRI